MLSEAMWDWPGDTEILIARKRRDESR